MVNLYNEEGRLKVSTKPAEYPAITGNLTAIQATVGTAVAGGTVEADTSRASNVLVFLSGTFSAYSVIFEGSIDNGVNWFTVQAVRTSSNVIETAPGSLTNPMSYAWEASVNALTNFRVRCTARTSGTAVVRIVLGSYATEPIPAIQSASMSISSGTITTVSSSIPVTPTDYALACAATTNATNIKTSAGRLWTFHVSNVHSATIYVKIYRKASAPTVGTDLPTLIVPCSAYQRTSLDCGATGEQFTTGIAIATTLSATDNATDALPAAGLVKIKASYS